MASIVYEKIRQFKDKYPMTVAWRLKRHCEIIDMHLNPDETVEYAFVAQKNDNPIDIITTAAIVLTNKRILIGQKRLLFGYFYTAITPDMFNDLSLKMGLIWGKVYIDTVKEVIRLSNLQREALPEIETAITEYMIREKQKYGMSSEKTTL
ncbi:MAG: hypothetical protein E7173_03935 [Firmicutes bacterium]|nr:hypothetical protein [Bacillota bacterium]